MQLISASVGENATNTVSDVALVQVILLKTTRAAAPNRAAGPYLASYDGAAGPATTAAIKAFQADHLMVLNAAKQSVLAPSATLGQVKPSDATWAKLLTEVPAEFANLRVLSSGKIVYVQATAAELQGKISAANDLTFTATFRTKVIACINKMHADYGIAVGVCPKGDRRTFQAQFQIRRDTPANTKAGPGESNHNYGMATDIGFAGLRWLHANGTVQANEDPWLKYLHAAKAAEETRFWTALRTVGTSAAVGAFRGPLSDSPHLQNWDDSTVSMTLRLAAHLQASGTMKWSRGVVASGATTYKCDLGLGVAQYDVGTAMQIWDLNATLTAATLTQARAAAAAAAAAHAPRGTPPPKPQPPATAADVTAMRQALRAQFDLADTNWRNWTP